MKYNEDRWLTSAAHIKEYEYKALDATYLELIKLSSRLLFMAGGGELRGYRDCSKKNKF